MNQLSTSATQEESIPEGEAAQIDELTAIMCSIQEQRTPPVPRQVHPKQHGCLRAELAVERGLPDAFKHGLFRTARTYPALVRFSNAKQRDDRLPDGHGMAIKLLDVEGEKLLEQEAEAKTQDFVLIDHPVFFAKNAHDLIPLMQDFRRLMVGGIIGKVRTVLKAMFSFDYRFRLLRRMGAKRPDNPLEIQYWSATPLKFGAGAAKLSLLPQIHSLPVPPAKSADKLRLAMAGQLEEREARFDFLVQLRTHPATMPVEDATAVWDERESPFRKVATLRIPRQIFDSPEQIAFGERLSFTPWHGLVDHRPLGGINRARRKVYAVMAARRLELNDVARREPTLGEFAKLGSAR